MRALARAALLAWIALNLIGTWSLLQRSEPFDHADSQYYFQRGREIARGQWGTEALVVSHVYRPPAVAHASFDHWQPLAAVLCGGAGRLVGDAATGARLVLFLFGSLLLPAEVYLFVVAGGASSLAGLSAAALYLSLAALDPYRLAVDSVCFAGVFLIAGCLAGGLALDRPTPRAIPAAACGAAFACAAMTRGDALVVGLLLTVLVARLAPRGRRLRVLALAGGAFAAVWAPLVLANLVRFGAPLAPGPARVPWLTSYCEWAAFGSATAATPAPAALLGVRALALYRAVLALLRTPLVALGLSAAAVGLVAAGPARRAASPLPAHARLLALALASYGGFACAGVLLAPALTLWFHRSPLPYWPIVLAGGVLAVDRLLRGRSWPVRGVAAATLLLLVSPSLSFNPLRHLAAEARTADPRAAEAAATLPASAVVATNDPLALYLHHHAGVVRLPNDGDAAIAEALRYFDVDYLVVFRIEHDCTSELDRFVRRSLGTPEASGRIDLPGGLGLERAAGGAAYAVFRVERPPGD